MKITRLIKSLVMIFLIGGGMITTSGLVHKTMNNFHQSTEDEIHEQIGEEWNKQEIIFWVSILVALGASVLLVILIMDQFLSYSVIESLQMSRSNSSLLT